MTEVEIELLREAVANATVMIRDEDSGRRAGSPMREVEKVGTLVDLLEEGDEVEDPDDDNVYILFVDGGRKLALFVEVGQVVVGGTDLLSWKAA